MAAPAIKDVQARVDELRAELNHHLYRYHVLDDPEISDAAYDRLYDELKALEEEHPDLITPDSPTQRVGAPPSDKFEKSRHLTPMGSLDKVTTDEALAKWAEDIQKRLDSDEPVAFVIEPKIDGSAINLVYERGAFARRTRRSRPHGRFRSGSTASANATVWKPRRTSRRSRGCVTTAFARIPTRSGWSRSKT